MKILALVAGVLGIVGFSLAGGCGMAVLSLCGWFKGDPSGGIGLIFEVVVTLGLAFLCFRWVRGIIRRARGTDADR